MLLWRGGAGWLLFDRQGEQFAASDGTELRASTDGWLVRHVRGDQLQFDRQGRLVRAEPALGSSRAYAYDQSGRLTSISAGPGNYLLYHYDAQGHTTNIDGPEGLSLSYAYDGAGRLVQVLNARQVKITYQYDAAGQLSLIEDSFGKVQAVERKADDVSSPPADAIARAGLLLADQEVKLNAQGCVEETRDRQGTARYAYDGQGRLASLETPEGVTRYEYDKFGRRTATIEPNGRTTRTQYNSLDLPR